MNTCLFRIGLFLPISKALVMLGLGIYLHTLCNIPNPLDLGLLT
jgi:hypothetical protein